MWVIIVVSWKRWGLLIGSIKNKGLWCFLKLIVMGWINLVSHITTIKTTHNNPSPQSTSTNPKPPSPTPTPSSSPNSPSPKTSSSTSQAPPLYFLVALPTNKLSSKSWNTLRIKWLEGLLREWNIFSGRLKDRGKCLSLSIRGRRER